MGRDAWFISGQQLGPGIKSSRVFNPLSNGKSFEINNRNSFLFLRKKEKDDVRPTVYRTIASSGMGFTEKEWHDEDGETTSTRMQMKATRNNENFRRNERNNGDTGSGVRAQPESYVTTI